MIKKRLYFVTCYNPTGILLHVKIKARTHLGGFFKFRRCFKKYRFISLGRYYEFTKSKTK